MYLRHAAAASLCVFGVSPNQPEKIPVCGVCGRNCRPLALHLRPASIPVLDGCFSNRQFGGVGARLAQALPPSCCPAVLMLPRRGLLCDCVQPLDFSAARSTKFTDDDSVSAAAIAVASIIMVPNSTR